MVGTALLRLCPPYGSCRCGETTIRNRSGTFRFERRYTRPCRVGGNHHWFEIPLMLLAAAPDDPTGMEVTTSSGLRDSLREATASAHRELDTRFAAFDITSRRGYRRFLEASAAALWPLEAALEQGGVNRIFADWPERSRRAPIAADLDRLGGSVRLLADVRPLNRNGMLGTMYVLEGSRLGAKYLLRMIAQSADPLSRRRGPISVTARDNTYGAAFWTGCSAKR